MQRKITHHGRWSLPFPILRVSYDPKKLTLHCCYQKYGFQSVSGAYGVTSTHWMHSWRDSQMLLFNEWLLNRGWTRGWSLPQVDRNPMFVHLSAAKCFRRNLNACNMRAPAGTQNTYSMSVSPQDLGDSMSCHRPCTHLDLTSMTQSTVWNRCLPTTVHLWILMLRQPPNSSSLPIII